MGVPVAQDAKPAASAVPAGEKTYLDTNHSTIGFAATPEFRQEGGEFVQTLWRPEPEEALEDVTAQVTAQEVAMQQGGLSTSH